MFLDFAVQNWYLFALLTVIMLLLAFDPGTRTVGGANKVSATQLPMLQHRQSAVIVDVRNKEEYATGHIAESIHLPVDDLENSLKKLNKYKSKPVVLVCQSGTRAGKASAILKKNDFENLYVLDGGIAAWTKENMPLTS